MTVPSTTRKAGPFAGTGANTVFPFAFKVFTTADVKVVVADLTGTESTLSTGYTVSMNADQVASPGGSVTLSTALTSGYKLSILGNLPYDQTLALPGGGNFNPVAIENALDRMVEQLQQVAEAVGRTLSLPASATGSGTLPAPAGSQIIGWDSGGTILQNYALAALATAITATTWGTDTFTGNGVQTVFPLTKAPGSANALILALSGVTQAPGTDFTVSGAVLTFTTAPPLGAKIQAQYGQSVTTIGTADMGNVFNTLAIASGGTGVTTLAGLNALITAPTALASINGGQLAGLRNRIINGNFCIAQLGATGSLATGSALSYPIDRWCGVASGANLLLTQVASGGGYRSRLSYSSGTNTGFSIGQRVESANSFSLAGGVATLQAKLSSTTLTSITWTAYYANTKDSFGTPAGYTRTQIATGTFTINSTEATYSASLGTIPGAATTGIEIVFSSAVGLASGQTFTIGDVQLEPGASATPFEHRGYAVEYALCNRYFRTIFGKGSPSSASACYAAVGQVISTTDAVFPLPSNAIAGMLREGALLSTDVLSSLDNGNSASVNGQVVNSYAVSFDALQGVSHFTATVTSGLVVNNAATIKTTNPGNLGYIRVRTEL